MADEYHTDIKNNIILMSTLITTLKGSPKTKQTLNCGAF